MAYGIQDYWGFIKDGNLREKWLLRNHLRSPYEQTPERYHNEIWDKGKVIGLKTIRANHLLQELSSTLNASHVIYIIRHPLACLASILRRPQFWNEFGWEWHWQTFVDRSGYSTAIHDANPTTLNEKIIAMWAISQQIAVEQVKKLNGYVIAYETLYSSPFEETKNLLCYLGYENCNIHPSYLFEPSMTSMRTLHNSPVSRINALERFPSFFWEEILNQEESKVLLRLIKTLPVNQPEILHYLNT